VDDHVKRGESIFYSKTNEELVFVSPISGKIKDIVRGERRKILNIIVESDGKDSFVKNKPTNLKKCSADDLKSKLSSLLQLGKLSNNDTVITNARHYDALMRASQSINNVKKGLKTGITGDLLSIDIRESIHHFGRITGEISTDDLLGNIFSNFCIGK